MDIKTIPKLGAVLAAVGIGLGASVTADAALIIGFPMQYSSPNIVGTAEGFNGDNPGNDASWLAQNILNVAGLNAITFSPIPTDTEPTRKYHNSSSFDYSGTIQGLGIKNDTPSQSPFIAANTVPGVPYQSVYVPTCFEYAIAKYDGHNAGWGLFYLNGQDAYLPVISHSFWGTGPDQYEMSSFTVFNAVPEPTTIIAGALLLLPFGASTLRIVRNRKP